MIKQPKNPRLKRGRFALRLILFTLVVALVCSYATYVLTPKHDFGICSMVNLYQQKQNTIDVLTVGTSLAYAGVNTNVLWSEYGIAAYNLCSAEQPFWVSFYTIKEALKTQQPKVILLDAKPAIYTRDYTKRGRTILSTYGIRGPENRIGAMLACVEKPEDALGYILGLPEVHSNYKKVKAKDFIFPPDNGGRGTSWKGYIEIDEISHHQRPSLVWSGAKGNLNEREEEYARKIFELTKARGIELILVGMPNPDYANDHLYYNALWSIAQEYGIKGINYNHPDLRYGLRYSSDFADWQHLNVKGSVTFSRKLAEDLKGLLALPDRREDPLYESYQACAKAWYANYPFFALADGEGRGNKWQKQY